MSNLTIQLLIATMNQNPSDYSLLEKMHVQCDAIVCNQCDRFSYAEIEWNGHSIKWFDFDEKGVGLNRNNALMRATADYVVICDDDMVFVDHYPELLLDGFKKNPKADILIYNLAGRKLNSNVHRINRTNFLRYGAARIAAKTSALKSNGIFFNTSFGGGTECQHGEDNIFLSECLEKGLKIYSYPVIIAKLTNDRPSTWRKKFDNKYFSDQGKLYKQVSRKFWKELCFIDSVRHHKRYSCSWYSAYSSMVAPNRTIR